MAPVSRARARAMRRGRDPYHWRTPWPATCSSPQPDPPAGVRDRADVRSAVISLYRWDSAHPGEFVGPAQLLRPARDPQMWNAMRNTLFFCLLTIPTGIALSLALAIAVNTSSGGWCSSAAPTSCPSSSPWSRWRSSGAGSTTSTSAAQLVHRPVRRRQGRLARQPGDGHAGGGADVVWKSLGWNMTLFLAGLQGIPPTCTRPPPWTAPTAGSSSATSPGRLLSPTTSSSP